MSTAASVLERCAALGRVSEEPERLVRRYATPAMREANDLVGGWMRDAGLAVREDAAGNLIGRRDGPGKTLVLGSHLDTVVDAGRYDGPLGVLAALAVLERLWDRALPFAVELIGFADEEGVRYGDHVPRLERGRRPLRPRLARARGRRRRHDGRRAARVRRRPGRDRLRRRGARRTCSATARSTSSRARCSSAAARRSASSPRSRARRTPRSASSARPGHAGTVPMNARRDALAAAAEWMLAVESVARRRQGTVATVGRIAVEPGARNVIPGEARMTLDVRHTSNAVRREAIADLRAEAQRIARRARGRARLGRARRDRRRAHLAGPHATCSPTRSRRPATRPSGCPAAPATTRVAMAALTDIAMLFVRCERGISHNPAEAVAEADVAVALDVLERFLGDLA